MAKNSDPYDELKTKLKKKSKKKKVKKDSGDHPVHEEYAEMGDVVE